MGAGVQAAGGRRDGVARDCLNDIIQKTGFRALRARGTGFFTRRVGRRDGMPDDAGAGLLWQFENEA